jgi:hypothetical protein
MKASVFAVLASLSLASAAIPLAQDPVVRITSDKMMGTPSLRSSSITSLRNPFAAASFEPGS